MLHRQARPRIGVIPQFTGFVLGAENWVVANHSDPLGHRRDPRAAADAHRHQRKALVRAPQLAGHRARWGRGQVRLHSPFPAPPRTDPPRAHSRPPSATAAKQKFEWSPCSSLTIGLSLSRLQTAGRKAPFGTAWHRNSAAPVVRSGASQCRRSNRVLPVQFGCTSSTIGAFAICAGHCGLVDARAAKRHNAFRERRRQGFSHSLSLERTRVFGACNLEACMPRQPGGERPL